MSVYQTPAFVQSVDDNELSGASVSVTLSASSTAKNTLILFAGWGNNVTISSVADDGGNTWTSIPPRQGSGPYLQIWYAAHADPADTITATFSSSVSDCSLVCHEYSGLAPGGLVMETDALAVSNADEIEAGTVEASAPALVFLAVRLRASGGAWVDTGLANSRVERDLYLTADETTWQGEFTPRVTWRDAANAVAQVVVFRAALQGTALDDAHHYSLMIDGTDYISQVRGMITVTQPEAGEIGTMRFTLQALGTALLSSITSWKAVELVIDSAVYFGGYIVSSQPALDQDQPDGWEAIDVVVEEWATVLARTEPVNRRYVNTNPGDIVADLFDRALDPDGTPPNQTEFDTTTHVSAGSWGSLSPTFLVDNEIITEALDRLALLCNFVWWIDGGKKVHFGLTSGASAPFAIATVAAANYTTTFPPLSKPSVRRDGSDIRNRVTVYGGVQVLKNEETLTGDGSTLIFQLAHFPVVDMVRITVGGVLQSWGTDWYHSFDDYDVLIDYTCGTIRWDTGNAPANGAAIVVGYYYGAAVQVTVYNTETPTSYSTYGRWFDYEVVDRSITNPDLAQAVARAMVNEYEWETVDGRLQVERLGIKPGQALTVVLPGLGLNAAYPVRQVVTEISRAGIARCEINFGGRRRTLGAGIEGTRQAGPLSRSTRWQDRILTASLHPTAAKAQGSLMLSIGQTSTDQLAVNTNTPAAATAYQWPIYNKDGSLAGYVPVYKNAW